ncbi:hypothetical protein EGW08_020895, partial [Elysia chlorotica]
MVKPNLKIYDSPRKYESGSESEQAAASLQMVSISSPRSKSLQSADLGKASPQKRESSRLAALSPMKGSPLKKNGTVESECSPRKRSAIALDFSPLKNSPKSRSPAVSPQKKTLLVSKNGDPETCQSTKISSPEKKPDLSVTKSPLKRESSRLAVQSPAKGSPLKRDVNLNDSECSPRKRLTRALDLSSVKTSPIKCSLANGSPRKSTKNSEKAPGSPGSVKTPSKSSVGASESSKKAEALSTKDLSVFDPLQEVQQILRRRISQTNCPPSICGYEKERKQLHDLIKRTAVMGESNSLLLIGPRGCGKSMLIQNVLEDVYQEEKIKQDLLLVKLNGLLQSDDRIALREITRQLQLENTVGDKVFGSFAETLQFLLEALKKGDESSKPIVFVLEEFDLFAQHKNQTLLYNLFDISQSAQAPICVIGITCRLDVVELLEKRVKSRFSHRQIYLFNKLTLTQYRRLCFDYLSLPGDFPDKSFAKNWNSNIEVMLDEVAVKDVLERQFSLMNDVRGLLSLLTYPVCNISAAHPTITASDLITSFKLISTDTKSAMLHGVSILELAIIIAMKHLTDIYEGEPFNFEMVYSEYLKFARHRSGMQVYEKAIVMK